MRRFALDPDPTNFYYTLAASLQFFGKFKRAKAADLEILKRDERHHRA